MHGIEHPFRANTGVKEFQLAIVRLLSIDTQVSSLNPKTGEPEGPAVLRQIPGVEVWVVVSILKKIDSVQMKAL
jgi:hypothetical protein